MWNHAFWTTAALVASVATWAGAQISVVEPYFAVVTADATNMHSGDMRQYYVVAQLQAGTIVRVDGEGGGFSRVSYPDGLTGFAPTREVRDLGDGRVEVTRPTALKALNMERGFGGSWQNLVPAGQELKPGDTLRVVDTITRSDGSVAAFVVVPPPAARGFIESSRLRRATPEERARFLGETPGENRQPAGGTGAGAPAPSPSPTPVVITPPEEASDSASSDPISLLDEIAPPASAAPAEPQAQPPTQPPTQPQPAPAQPTSEDQAEQPLVTEQVVGETSVVVEQAPGEQATPTPQPAPAEPLEIVVTTPVRPVEPTPVQPQVPSLPSVAALDSLFDQVRRQPLMEAELDELAAQFRRVRDGLSDSPVDRSLADRIDERLAVLDVMIDLRDRRRELADKRAALDVSRVEVERRIADANARAGFTFVGQIVPSSVYDGVRLPRLYRVVSVDDAGTRTLAYVRDSDTLLLDQKVGRVVGLDGSLRMDPALGVRILSASRASVLRPDGG